VEIGELEIYILLYFKAHLILRKFPAPAPSFLPLQKPFCFNLDQIRTLDNDNDPETWIVSPIKKFSPVLDRKLDRSSFFTIAALKRRPTTWSRKYSLQSQASCIDPSASEEHGNEEETGTFTSPSYPLPARSLFSAHEEVIAAFSAGQRRLQQRMSAQQRRASIAEAHRERQEHMEILEQHFGRRFLRRAMTIVEENDKLLAEKEKKERNNNQTAPADRQPIGVVSTPPPPSEEVNSYPLPEKLANYNNYYYNDEQLIKNIYARTFTTNKNTKSTSHPISSPAATTAAASFSNSFDESDNDDVYIDANDSSGLFLFHAEFSLGGRSTTEDLETVATF
jgi:hypothetical protein